MRFFPRLRRRAASSDSAGSGSTRGAASKHLAEFARTRRDVEGYVEPATTVTPTTLLLVAHDGEWTRRPVPGREAAFGFARKLGVPVYDINLSGYPQRMREFNARKQREQG